MSDTITKERATQVLTHDHLKITPLAYNGPKEGESIFTFKNFYIEYARFHRNETNKLIHFLFIPLIATTMTGLVFYNPMICQTQVVYDSR